LEAKEALDCGDIDTTIVLNLCNWPVYVYIKDKIKSVNFYQLKKNISNIFYITYNILQLQFYCHQ